MNLDVSDLPVVGTVDTGSAKPSILMVGNPNAGKTTLFNSLTGLRAKTANYPGVTVEHRKAKIRLAESKEEDGQVELIDLPGLYSLNPASPEEALSVNKLSNEDGDSNSIILLVLDASNLSRNLFLAEQVLLLNRPTLVAVNMIDAAEAAGISIDLKRLSKELCCPVVATSAKTGQGIGELKTRLHELVSSNSATIETERESCVVGCKGCPAAARHQWAENVCKISMTGQGSQSESLSWLDRWLTSPLSGSVSLFAIMLGVFLLIFSTADIPMSMIESGFGWLGERLSNWIEGWNPSRFTWFAVIPLATMAGIAFCFWLGGIGWSRWAFVAAIAFSIFVAWLPVDEFQSLIVDGVIGGLGGVVVFLPQIVILFFIISLLEDSGYLARAAFVMERWMRRVGLPGKAFLPMLSSHACAIPGIMAARTIESKRDRLVTIMVLPLLTCSARLPVYAMIVALLFPGKPLFAALTFMFAYLLGLAAAMATAFVLKRTVLPGEASPFVLELPPYRMPTLRNAILTAWDRAAVFLRTAGTTILLISVILWALTTYPRVPENQTANLMNAGSVAASEMDTDAKTSMQALEYSIAGRVGHFIEPVFAPLGFDWKMNVGVLSSFAAREVFVSTLSVIYGVGEVEDVDQNLVERLRTQTNSDGSPVFNTANSFSLLVFYVLAMQCLPTQVVTRRETGTWKWPLFQFGYMTILAWIAGAIVFQTLALLGWAS